MTRKSLSLQPIEIDDDTWLYAERTGISVVRQLRTPLGLFKETVVVLVPWSAIEKARDRRPKPKRRAQR